MGPAAAPAGAWSSAAAHLSVPEKKDARPMASLFGLDLSARGRPTLPRLHPGQPSAWGLRPPSQRRSQRCQHRRKPIATVLREGGLERQWTDPADSSAIGTAGHAQSDVQTLANVRTLERTSANGQRFTNAPFGAFRGTEEDRRNSKTSLIGALRGLESPPGPARREARVGTEPEPTRIRRSSPTSTRTEFRAPAVAFSAGS